MNAQKLIAFLDEQTAQIAAREPDLAFEPSEYAGRLTRLRSAMEAAKIDALVVSAPDAMCWLHGYQARWYKAHSSTAWPPFHCTVAHVDHDRLLPYREGVGVPVAPALFPHLLKLGVSGLRHLVLLGP